MAGGAGPRPGRRRPARRGRQRPLARRCAAGAGRGAPGGRGAAPGPRDRRLGAPGAQRGLAPRAPGRARHHRAGPGRRPPGPVRGGAGRRRRLARPGGRGGAGPRRRGAARRRLAGSRGGRGAGGHRLRGLPAAVATGGGTAGVGTSTRRLTAGRTRPVPGAATPTPCSPGSAPRSGGGPTRPAEPRSCAGPQHDLNARAPHSGHDRSHCPRRPGEQRVRGHVRRRGRGGPLRRLLPGHPAGPRWLASGRGRQGAVPQRHPVHPRDLPRRGGAAGRPRRTEAPRAPARPGARSLLLAGAGPRGRRLLHAGRGA